MRVRPISVVLTATFLALAGCDEDQPPVIEQVRAIKTITVSEPASGDVRRFSGVIEATDAPGRRQRSPRPRRLVRRQISL